ncbi:MAG: hypothetical protein DSZ03_07705 [Sulfurimonas sp.]|nr:MAG: hypothetical protein DSZ03_07705 [Sulfurimonas sp.]
MAGVHFAYNNFPSLLQLNMGIADRLDDNRAESFTILYCNFQKVEDALIIESLEKVLRGSDVIVNSNKDYFFILPYTDKYGATIVKNMFEEFFDLYIPSYEASYPLNGETPEELFQSLQAGINKSLHTYLECLDF